MNSNSNLLRKYQTKIQQQAHALSQLLQRCQSAEAYTQLVERRLTEIAPDHPLPVTEDLLGIPAFPTSGPESHPETRHTASHILASTAAHKKQLSEARTAYDILEKQHFATVKRLEDVSSQNQQSRADLEAANRTIASLQRRLKHFTGKVSRRCISTARQAKFCEINVIQSDH